MPEKTKAAPGKKAAPKQTHQRTDILADDEQAGKQGVDFGVCRCGTRISSNVVTLHCPTCSAWAKWRSAHRTETHAAEVAR